MYRKAGKRKKNLKFLKKKEMLNLALAKARLSPNQSLTKLEFWFLSSMR